MRTLNKAAFAVIALATASIASADIQWNVTYLDTSGGFSDPSLGTGRRQVVNAVTSYLNTVLDADGVVDFRFSISLNQGNAGNGPLATSGPRFSNSPNGFQNGHLFVHATTGVDADSGNPDATAQVDFGYTWNNTTAQPTPSQVDLQSVLLHEFTHSLGILSRVNSSGQSSVTSSDPGVYSVYNSFMRVGNTASATPLFGTGGNYLGTSQDLITPNPGIYFWGSNAMAANGGKPVRVFVQNFFNASSISHLGANSVMRPSTAPGTVARRFTAIDLGVLRDLGWNIKPQGPGGQLGSPNFKILNVNPSAGGSDNLNSLTASGLLGDHDIEEGGTRTLFVEDLASARPGVVGGGGSSGGLLTQVGHPEAPNAIALLADNARETSIGMTWFAPADNLAIPTANDMATRYSFAINPNARGGTAGSNGTFADFVLGARNPGESGGAAATSGVGLRLHSTGEKAGKFEVFDGTSGRTLLEGSGQFASANATNGLFNITLELLGATFDPTVAESANLYLGGQLVHSFTTDAGFAGGFTSWFAGGTAPDVAGGITGQALYTISNIDFEVVQVPEPAAVAWLGLAAFACVRRRR